MPKIASSDTLIVQTALEYEEIEPGLFIYKKSVTSETFHSEGIAALAANLLVMSPQKAQGVVDAAGFAELINGKTVKPRDLCCVSADALEHFRQNGWPTTDEGFKFLQKNRRDDVYDAIVADGWGLDTLVRFYGDGHMIFDRNDLPLPLAVWFDYMSGSMDNGHYDLKKAAEILLERDDVVLYACDRNSAYSERPTDKLASNAVEAIFPIPHYNSGTVRNKTLIFRWKPSLDDYRRAWNAIKDRPYPSTKLHEAVFELDIFGLRAGGAALFDSYWKSVREESDTDDE